MGLRDDIMFPEPTVLVLGAGASYPYGFPLGAELKRWIIGTGAPFEDEELTSTLNKLGHSQKEVEEFRLRLGLEVGIASIDSFLFEFPDYELIGKRAIAFVISRCERLNNLLAAPRPQHSPCYEALLPMLSYRSLIYAKDKGSNLKVITFNYDRSLEMYLTLHYSQSADKGRWGDAIGGLKDIVDIIHVYGDLGNLVDEEYTATPSLESVERRAESIRTIGQRALTHEIYTARSWLSNARVVAFIGFGGDATNRKLLGIEPDGQFAQRCTPSKAEVGFSDQELHDLHRNYYNMHGLKWESREIDPKQPCYWWRHPEALIVTTTVGGGIAFDDPHQVSYPIDERILDQPVNSIDAIRLASEAAHGQRMASCIVSPGRIISRGGGMVNSPIKRSAWAFQPWEKTIAWAGDKQPFCFRADPTKFLLG